MALTGTELVQITPVDPIGSPAPQSINTTTQAIANLGGGSGSLPGYATTTDTVIGEGTPTQSGNTFYNTYVGANAGAANTTGNSNVAVGTDALESNTTGIFNTAVGDAAQQSATGTQNTSVGSYSLTNASGNQNTAIGEAAGYDITTGSNNIAIGYNASVPDGTASNVAQIGNAAVEDLYVGTTHVVAGGVVQCAGIPLPFVGTAPVVGWTRPALATFDIWLNQGDATASDGVGGLPLTIVSDTNIANTTGNLTAILKTIGAGPWTITCALAGSANVQGGNGNGDVTQWYAPIVLNNTGESKAVALIWTPSSNGAYVVHYTTTVPGTAATPVSSGGALWGGSSLSYFSWFRVVNDGTNLTFQISDEGQEWMTFYEESVTALVPSFDTVGFGMELANFALGHAGTQYLQASKLWQWTD